MNGHLARRVAAFCLPLAAGVRGLAAQTIEYAEGTSRYRVVTNAKIAQSMAGNSNSTDINGSQLLTLKIARTSKDTLTTTLSIDSISMGNSGVAPDLGKIQGSAFTGYISPTGRFYSAKASEGMDPALAPLAEGFARFLPAFPRGLSTGTTWSDTVNAKKSQQGLDLDQAIITSYRVDGDTTVDGQKALRIVRNSNATITGAGAAQGMSMTLQSTGTSTGAFFLSRSGVYLGGTSTDDTTTKVLIAAQNMEITTTQRGTTTTQRVH